LITGKLRIFAPSKNTAFLQKYDRIGAVGNLLK
jgi:hypothetical protein